MGSLPPQDDRGWFSPELPWSELQSHHAQRFENSVMGEGEEVTKKKLMVVFHHLSSFLLMSRMNSLDDSS